MSVLTTNCDICLSNIGESPSEGGTVGAHVVTKCGHLFHQLCWDEWVARSGGLLQTSCPSCRTKNDNNGTDVRRVYPTICEGALGLCEEIASLKLEISTKNQQLASLTGKHGSRIFKNKRFPDSTCFNCESKEHLSCKCTSSCYIRNADKTGYEKFEPIQKYGYLMKLPGRPAGTVISFYENRLGVKLDREGIQLAFAFYFFDDGCWTCGSPFHHRPECEKDEKPELHKIAREMHEINHPPSPEELLRRFERKARFESERV